MLRFCLILISVGTALAGVPYHTSYLNSAGVGYSSVEPAGSPVYLPQLGYAYSNVYSSPRALVGGASHVVVAPPVQTAYTAPYVPAVAHLPAETNVIDIHHPKVSTRKFEIRRPAIEKQFYDVEERIVIRPAGKAVVELEQPVSKSQRGPAVVSSISAVNSVYHPFAVTPGIHAPVHQGVVHTPVVSPAQPPQNVFLPEQPQPGNFPSQQENFPQQAENDQSSQFDDSDSVTIENAEIANARSQLQQSNEQPLNVQQFPSGYVRTGTNQPTPRFQFDLISQQQRPGQLERQPSVEFFRSQQAFDKRPPSEQNQQVQSRFLSQNAQQFDQVNPQPYQYNQYPRTNTQPLRTVEVGNVRANPRSGNVFQQNPGHDFNAKFRTGQTASNQEHLIDLLTARGGVTEERGYGEDAAGRNPVRARVLSVTPSPRNAEHQDEKISTRRIVVNRPITTVEEVDVIEPFTKVERVAVNQPALIKTAAVSVPTVPVQHYAYTVSPLI